MKILSRDEHIYADVLVLGGGLGGCFAAIKAAEAGARVVVFEKAHILRSGSNATGSGRITLIHPDYNYTPEQFAKLNVETGGGIVDEDIPYEFARHCLHRVLELESYGIQLRGDDGSFFMMQGPDIAPGKIVFWPPGPRVWQDMKPKLARKVMEYENINVLNRTAAIGLLTRDGVVGGEVVGAVGIGTRTGQFVICEAKSVVLTSGNSHRLARHHDTCYAPSRFVTVSPPTNCGEGQAMAFRAGADLVNMEFAYVARIWKDFAHAGVGQTTGAGGKTITGTGAELGIEERYRLTHQGGFNTQRPIYVDPRDVEGWPEEKGMME
ncbi:MAG: FAD-dependent oxidoreductase, partial [Deltaproteobacteria bacterium]|nr:FAD-dependent oxidoreductase [Deltaproteobacteria bacterium]